MDNSKFQVTFHGDCVGDSHSVSEIGNNSDNNSSLIHLFEKVHNVSIDSDRVMYFYYCSFETTGIFCVHMVWVCQHVAESCDMTFLGFTHRDIDVHWTSAYMHLAY